MEKNDAVVYRDYLLYPLALYLPPKKKWQAMVIVTRDAGDEDMTLPRSQSFPQLPDLFDEEAAALRHAVQYGKMLIDGRHQGLKI